MGKWKELNMPLRTEVIGAVLRLEQTSSDALRSILRVIKQDSKSLHYRSSALSFKAKIDLLYDLDELEKIEYTHLLKMMEIRNQFAHNPGAISFESLDNVNPEINKYLERYSKENPNEVEREKLLRNSFSEIFQVVAGKLLFIDMQYVNGIHKQMRQYLNDQIVENIEEIWKKAKERHKENYVPTPHFLFPSNDNIINQLYSDFRIVMGEYSISILDKLKDEKLFEELKPKESIEEMKARIKKMSESNDQENTEEEK